MARRNSGTVSFYSIVDDEITSFDDIENNILSKNKIEYAQADRRRLAQLELNPEDPRLRMVHSWSDERQRMTQTIDTIDKGTIKIDILVTDAKISRQKQNVWNDDKKDLKSQVENVSVEPIQVVFICIDNEFSLIIRSVDNHILGKICDYLIGSDSVSQGRLDLTLFGWLWWKYAGNHREISSFFKIPVMTAFVGNIGDMENDSKITGNSEDIEDMGAVALQIATDEKLKAVGLKLIEKDNDGETVFNVTFKFDEFLTIVLDFQKSSLSNSSLCLVNEDVDDILPDRNKQYIEKLVYIYTYIIPRLKDLYLYNQDEYEMNYLEFRNNMAMKVYRIMINSGISKNLFDVNDN